MSLILPGSPAFSECTDNLTGTPPAAVPGTNFTAGASNADGTAVSVLGALAHDVHYLVVGIGGLTSSTADSSSLLDVLTDPAGGTAWGTWIDDLVCGYSPDPAAGIVPVTVWYHFPIYLKAGHSVGVRCRTAHTSTLSGQVVMYAYGCPQRPDMWWCGSRVESLGINPASSSGTVITPGNSGTFSAWTSVGSNTSGRFQAIQFTVNAHDASSTALGYYWQVGAGGSQLRGTPTIYLCSDSTERAARSGPHAPIFCDVPEGTQMQLRATCSGTAEAYDAAVYGVI